MNISGVTTTAQVLPTQPVESAQAAGTPTQPVSMPSEVAGAVGADSVAFSAQVATQVQDMALNQFEQAADQLVSQMAAATGVGQNVDMYI